MVSSYSPVIHYHGVTTHPQLLEEWVGVMTVTPSIHLSMDGAWMHQSNLMTDSVVCSDKRCNTTLVSMYRQLLDE